MATAPHEATELTRRRFLKATLASGLVGAALRPARANNTTADWAESVRIGLHQAGWDRLRLEVFFQTAASLGYDGVELAPPWLEKTHDLEKLLRLLKSAGTRLAPAVFVGGQELREPSLRQAYLQKARKWARWTKAHGGRYVIYSTVAGAGARRTPTERRHVREAFDRVADVVLAEGCRPLYHNHYVRSCEESRRLLEEDLRLLDWSRWRLCVDTGHLVLAKQDPVSFLRQWADRVAWMHCKDVRTKDVSAVDSPGVRWQDQFTTLGTGVVDFPHVLRVLEQHQYGGWLIVEQDVSSDPRRTARESLSYLRRVLRGELQGRGEREGR